MKNLPWIVAFLTLTQIVAAACFSIPGYGDVIAGPQHGHLGFFKEIEALLNGNASALFWYRAFFINDLIWISTLLLLLFHYLWKLENVVSPVSISNAVLPILFFVSGATTFLFDLLENISYFIFNDALFVWLPLQVIVSVKVIAFSVCLLIMLVGLYQNYFFNLLGEFKSSFQASVISIIGIAMLFGLSTFMDQGSTVIIHLLDSPASLVCVIILINLLALVSGHYPDYINKYLKQDDSVKWHMDGLFGGKSNTGLGLITYNPLPHNHENIKDAEVVRQADGIDRGFFNHFRKIIGVIVMITWLYVLFFVFNKYVPFIPPLAITVLILALSLILHFHTSKIKQGWREYVNSKVTEDQSLDNHIARAIKGDTDVPSIFKSVRNYSNLTLGIFLALILAACITVLSVFAGKWITTWIALMVTTLINIVFIVLFQNFRTLINLPLAWKGLRWVPIRALGNDVRHVRLYALSGFVSLGLFIMITIDPSATNALPIILMAIFLLYGFVVVLIKHHVYYAVPGNGQMFPFFKNLFTLFVPILGFLFLVWVVFNGKTGNGLHKIPILEESSQLVQLDTFKTNLTNLTEDTKYLVASYGGGIRATAWTMLVLDTLDKSKRTFFDNTLAMSGVSGGFLGLSFYTSIRTEHENDSDRYAAISAIGRHNLLSIDISYLFGFDMIRELFPYIKKFRYRDRAGRSMDAYAGLIQPDIRKKCNLLYSSYRSYWAKAYQSSIGKGGLYPALIGNTTGTKSHYGVAFPMQYDMTDGLFPGAIDILSIGHDSMSTISYLDAISTTERFPIFSPAADIREKGNFLDGGYFENSGLLSLMNFYEYLEHDDSLHLQDDHTKLVVLINSKDDYIRHILGDTVTPGSNKATSELGAIMQTVIDISTLSLALEKKYKHRFGDNYIPVYLPYPITYDDVKNLIGGVPTDPFAVQEIMNTSNKKVEETLKAYCRQHPNLKNEPIPPALARVLSDPAFHYTRAMLSHPEVTDALARIKQD